MLIVLVGFQRGQSQLIIADIIKGAITKVIKAVDLQIQRLQNKTIGLQNAQKALENEMSKLKLDDITDWVEKQRSLYASYFDELWKIKESIAAYHRVSDIVRSQAQLVKEYQQASHVFHQDPHFTPAELSYMEKVYSGILNESIKNLEQVYSIVTAFTTQMTDAKRMDIINHAAGEVDLHLADLRKFNDQQKLLSFQRAAAQGDIETVKQLYGL